MNGKPLQFFLFRGDDLLVVDASYRNRAWDVIRAERIENVGALSGEELTASIRGQASARRKDTQARHSILVLERTELALLNLAFPRGGAEETAAMLELELDRQLPLEAQKLCYGHAKHSGDGEDLVQVYWSPLDRIEPLLSKLKSAEIEVDEICPAMAFYRWISADAAPNASFNTQLFIHAGHIELIHWSAPGIVGFSRFSSDSEIERSLTALIEHRNDASPISLYSPEAQKQSISGLFAAMGLRSVHAITRFEWATNLTDDEQIEFLPILAVLNAIDADSLSSGSPRLTSTLNMLPRSIEVQRQRRQRRRNMIQTGVLALLFAVLGVANLMLYMNRLATQINANTEEIKRLTPEAKQVEAMEERIASIRRQINYVITPIEALGTVNKVLSDQAGRLEGLFLDHFDYTEVGLITLEGHSTNDITPWSFAEALDKTGKFKIVQKPRIEMHPYGETRAIRFQLSCQALTPSTKGVATE
ncbi:hypothetical protein LLG95_16730 [bacterium]|nr:hypothetical protein [bacterium]